MAGFYDQQACDIGEFRNLIRQKLDKTDVPSAIAVEKNVPIYHGPALLDRLTKKSSRRELLAEWANVLENLSGVFVIRSAVVRPDSLDDANRVFDEIIHDEKTSGAGGDHFAKAGVNDRIWNSLQKLCVRDPQLFARNFANPTVDAACEAWLGPGYGMTAQVNLVRPGGQAQVAHRDYHLGFMTLDQASSFPAHVHRLSPALTLQGAIAHCDMPLESGPTKLLPHSQLFGPGYIASQLSEFRDIFEAENIQLPLKKGDALFFNPALFHAAGSNISDSIHRLANLLQIGSAMGRTLEAIDRAAMARALYPVLMGQELSTLERNAVIRAAAEGYPFPTNLDRDPPVDGLAPESQSALMARFLDEGRSLAEFDAALQQQSERKLP